MNPPYGPLDIEALADAGTDSFGLERAMHEQDDRDRAGMQAGEDAAEREAWAQRVANGQEDWPLCELCGVEVVEPEQWPSGDSPWCAQCEHEVDEHILADEGAGA